jgi:hypothetical protein
MVHVDTKFMTTTPSSGCSAPDLEFDALCKRHGPIIPFPNSPGIIRERVSAASFDDVPEGLANGDRLKQPMVIAAGSMSGAIVQEACP